MPKQVRQHRGIWVDWSNKAENRCVRLWYQAESGQSPARCEGANRVAGRGGAGEQPGVGHGGGGRSAVLGALATPTLWARLVAGSGSLRTR